MKKPLIIIGIGEMGGVFARGFLRLGHPVYPLGRSDKLAQAAIETPEPEAVVVAVGEKDLRSILDAMPKAWTDRLILLQNELLPADYADFPEATVISIWFEKKPGQDFKVIIPSPVYGPRSALVQQALGTLNIPVKIVCDKDELLFELVLKNLYILTTNIAGLHTEGTVGELWEQHRELAQSVINDVIRLQEAQTGKTFDHKALIDALLLAFSGDPDHKCMGRSAPERLQRALAHGDNHDIELPSLAQIASEMH